MSIQYQPHIDGLRALSVLAVIFYHFELLGFSGGYLGVDVFFVISGYLISSIILKELNSDSFTYSGFYLRRVKRIIPVLLFVIICGLPAAYLLLDQNALQEFYATVMAALLFSSNILFWLQDGYYAEPSALKPLLHTWSLAVEEQFYLVFPFILVLLHKHLGRYCLQVIGLLLCVSLLFAEFGSRLYQDAAFYLLPTRLWELLAGVLLALMPAFLKGVSRQVSQLLSFAGFTGVVASFFLFSVTTRHPSFLTVIPVAGAVLLIAFAGNGSIVGRVLSWKPLVFVGLISYSLYLWHFLLLALFKNTFLEETLIIKVLLLVLTVCLSVLSYFLIEKPARRATAMYNRHLLTSLASVSVVILVMSFWQSTSLSKGMDTYQFNEMVVDIESEMQKRNALQIERCGRGICGEYQENMENILIIGDSMVLDAFNILVTVFPEKNYIQDTLGGCAPHPEISTLITFTHPDLQRCLQLNETRFDPAYYEGIDGVVLNNKLGWFSGADLKLYLDFLQSIGLENVLVFGDYLSLKKGFTDFLSNYQGDSQGMYQALIDSDYFDTVFAYEDELQTLTSAYGYEFISFRQFTCGDSDTCILFANGKPFSWDQWHFSLEFSQYLAKQMEADLKLTWLDSE